MIQLKEYVVALNEYPPLRVATEYKFPELFATFYKYTTTKSKYCPKVYLTCELIIKAIYEQSLNEEFEILLFSYYRPRRVGAGV